MTDIYYQFHGKKMTYPFLNTCREAPIRVIGAFFCGHSKIVVLKNVMSK